MRIGARLQRLERAAAAALPDRRCRACGHLRNRRSGERDPQMKYRVHRGEPGEPPIEGPDECPDCGTRLIIRIELDRAG